MRDLIIHWATAGFIAGLATGIAVMSFAMLYAFRRDYIEALKRENEEQRQDQ